MKLPPTRTPIEQIIWLAERAGFYRKHIREHPETASDLTKVAERYSRDIAELAERLR